MILFASTVHIWEIHTDMEQHAALGKQENIILVMLYREATNMLCALAIRRTR